MWVQQRVFLMQFVVFSLLCFSTVLCQENNDSGDGNNTVKKKNKRVQEIKFKNNLYDQVAQESDHDPVNNNGYLSTPYGMRIPTMLTNKARNPRAEPNYLRNYHYSSRDAPTSGNWGGDGRQLSSFSVGGVQAAAASSPSDYVFGDSEDNSVAAGGHGHQSYGHGHSGWGSSGGGGHSSGGHGGGHGHGKDCNSALGLLGVLGLASYLQNVLRQMSTTPTPAMGGGGRKRRDVETDTDVDYENEPRDNVTPKLLPLLVSISHARDGRVPMKCALRPYCIANSFLTKRLGIMGRPVCEQLQNVMESSVENSASFELKQRWRKANALRELRLAARSGVKGRNCFKLYPYCPQLERMAQNYNDTIYTTRSGNFQLENVAGFPLTF